jgi:hypothetical protein
MAFTSRDAKIKSRLGGRSDTWPDLPFGLTATSKRDKPGYGQLYIFDSAETTTKRLENESNQVCMAEIMRRLRHLLQERTTPYAGGDKGRNVTTTTSLRIETTGQYNINILGKQSKYIVWTTGRRPSDV